MLDAFHFLFKAQVCLNMPLMEEKGFNSFLLKPNKAVPLPQAAQWLSRGSSVAVRGLFCGGEMGWSFES